MKEGDRIIRSGVLADAIKRKDELVIEVMTEARREIFWGMGETLS